MAIPTVDMGVDLSQEESQTAVVVVVKDSEDLYHFFDSDDIKGTSWEDTFKAYAESLPIK